MQRPSRDRARHDRAAGDDNGVLLFDGPQGFGSLNQSAPCANDDLDPRLTRGPDRGDVGLADTPARIQERAAGIDERPVQVELPDISISAEETFDRDIADARLLHGELSTLVNEVATRMRRKELIASVIRLKIRRSDFSTCTRQQRFSPSTDDASRLQALAATLLTRWLGANPGAHVRLLGVGVAGLSPSTQLALFEPAPDEQSA